MKLLTTRKKQWRPNPFPCAELYEKTILYLFGLIPVKIIKRKIK